MRPVTLLFFVVAMLATSGCTALTGFGDLTFGPVVEDGGWAPLPDAMPDSSVEPDAGPDILPDAFVDPDAGPEEDAFVPDASLEDTGSIDAGPTDGDAMPPDAGPEEDAFMPDAEVPDAGPDADVMDAGPEEDAFVSDAGPEDTGPLDTGPEDTGPADAGPTDSGPPDTGPTDAGPPDCRTDPTQERCLIHVRFTSTPRIQYYWFQRYVRGVDGGPGTTEAWHPCNGGVRLIDATTSECVYPWVPVPGTEISFVPGYNMDTSACSTAACLATLVSVTVFDRTLGMADVMMVEESTPPVGSLPTQAFHFTVPSP